MALSQLPVYAILNSLALRERWYSVEHAAINPYRPTTDFPSFLAKSSCHLFNASSCMCSTMFPAIAFLVHLLHSPLHHDELQHPPT